MEKDLSAKVKKKKNQEGKDQNMLTTLKLF